MRICGFNEAMIVEDRFEDVSKKYEVDISRVEAQLKFNIFYECEINVVWWIRNPINSKCKSLLLWEINNA